MKRRRPRDERFRMPGSLRKQPGQGGIISLLKELTYCNLSLPSVSSRTLVVVWKSELTGQLARVEADHAISPEI